MSAKKFCSSPCQGCVRNPELALNIRSGEYAVCLNGEWTQVSITQDDSNIGDLISAASVEAGCENTTIIPDPLRFCSLRMMLIVPTG
jgi:hypothetical protein